MNRRTLALSFAVLLTSFLAALVLAEGFLRLYWADGHRYYLWPPNYSAEFTPDVDLIPGVGPVARLSVNSHGIRGPEWSNEREREYRILTIGGSTIESLYVDQSRNWSSLLQEELGETADGRRVWIGNLGRAGFNTRDHLGFMRLAIDQYDVDSIIMLIGGNDMIHRLMQGDDYDPFFIDDEMRYHAWLEQRFVSVPVAFEQRDGTFLERTFLWAIAKRAVQRTDLGDRRNIQRDKSGSWLVVARRVREESKKVDGMPALDSALDEFERNIASIVREAQRRGIVTIFLSQPSVWRTGMTEDEQKLLWWGFRPGGDFYSPEALARSMASYNERLLATCRELQVTCIDMASRIPRSFEFFYDDAHFSEAGEKHFAAELAAGLRTRPPFLK